MDRSGNPKRRILSLIMAVILCVGTILPASPLYAEAEQTSAVNGASAKDDASEVTPETENEPAQETPVPEKNEAEKIESFSAELFYGAEKQADGTWLWTVPETTDEYKAGHRFNFRLNYKLTGRETPADAISITVPRHILKDATGMNADTMEWSIPSESEVKSATVGGQVDESRISDNVNFAYRDGDRNHYEIYNFRAITGSSDGYIELSYLTSWSSFEYQDMKKMEPFQATMSYREKDSVVATKESDPISIVIDTSAKLTSVTQRAPYSRITTWDSAWGDASNFGISNTGAYYYLVWDIRSVVNATQSYDFSIDEDSPTSNPDGIKVLGYRFAGENQYTPADNKHVQRNSSLRGERWDHVLTAIPVSEVKDKPSWTAHNVVTVTVTPKDQKDPSTTMKSSADWSWSQPTFTEPGGIFNSYKRGDGAARTGNLFGGTTHRASSRGFRAGDYTRYDLEEFNGYDQEKGTTDSKTKRTSYGGFDFASWAVGFPNSYTADGDTRDPENYWKKKIRYTLTDEDVFLLNSDDALKSQDGSTNRTIENGSIDKDKAIKLQNGDFRIDSLGYSWYVRDAELNRETETFQEKAPVYQDDEVLTFEGKFNDSDKWTTFATYNLKSSTWEKNDTYVASMDGSSIELEKDQNLTAYRVTTENTHYYTEIFTVPSYSLKNSDRVMNLLKDHDKMILLNNNNVVVEQQGDTTSGGDSSNQGDSSWTQIFESAHSDADYACVSQKSSSLKKNVVSSSNNIRQRSYTITWRITEEEKVRTGNTTTGTARESYLPQDSGIFYDLLPDGAQLNRDSVDVRAGRHPENPYSTTKLEKLEPSSYDVRTITNYEKSGRTLLIIRIKDPGDYFVVTYDTQHSWDSVKDYGESAYNPVAYETGNDSIYGGSPDDGSGLEKDKDRFKNIAVKSGESEAPVNDSRFLYAENSWDIRGITSGSVGFTKRVKMDGDRQYGMTADARINDRYSYEIRFLNNFGQPVGHLIFFDSLENYKDNDKKSAWQGILQSVDVSQLEQKGVEPEIYISEQAVDPENSSNSEDLSNASIWTKVGDETDLSQAKAIAIDAGTTTDGKDFSLQDKESLVFHLYMKAPAESPDVKKSEENSGSEASGSPQAATNDKGYPCALNEAFMSYQAEGPSETAMIIKQGVTSVSLRVAGSISLQKISEADEKPIKGVSFRLYGTSQYGSDVDVVRKTDADGKITFGDLEMGTYTLQETATTNDFLLDPTEHTVTIDSTGAGKVDSKEASSKEPFSITNKPRIHADVQFIKQDSVTNVRVEGAEYRLSGTGGYGTNILQTAESDDGTVTFRNIEKGTYTLKETKAPSNYILDPTEYKVVIDESGNYTITNPSGEKESLRENDGRYHLKDEPLHSFTFIKKSSYNNEPLPGATFSLTGTSEAGNPVNKTARSSEADAEAGIDAGEVRFDGLEAGNYVLQETEAPEGYIKDTNQYVVTIDHNGNCTIEGMQQEEGVYQVFNRRARADKITVTKIWNDQNNPDFAEGHNPKDLDITLSTQVAEGANRTYKVVYHLNDGRTFPDGSQINEVTYNTYGQAIKGVYKEPEGWWSWRGGPAIWSEIWVDDAGQYVSVDPFAERGG